MKRSQLFIRRTTKRFPSSRCASAIQIVRPLESTVETQPQLQPGSAEIVGDDFPVIHAMDLPLLLSTRQRESDKNEAQMMREDAN